jgi:zinc D-Ala-D-Ala carboxypeptidase
MVKKETYTNIALAVFILAGIGVFYWQYNNWQQEKGELEYMLTQARQEKTDIESLLAEEQGKNNIFGTQITELSGTLDKLNKLSKTDPQLLQKYSKIFFLNEHYAPKNLVEISSQYMNDPARKAQILASTSPYLYQMLDAAKNDGLELRIISAYRSFSEQTSLKNAYSVTYGSGANKFSADQGYSEHQLGTAVDLTTSKLGTAYTSIAKTEEYKWLKNNAYKYGFILSYPEGNSYYVYEPWHWRFVGKRLAERLHEERENFYDLDQRKIDAYLVTIFD